MISTFQFTSRYRSQTQTTIISGHSEIITPLLSISVYYKVQTLGSDTQLVHYLYSVIENKQIFLSRIRTLPDGNKIRFRTLQPQTITERVVDDFFLLIKEKYTGY